MGNAEGSGDLSDHHDDEDKAYYESTKDYTFSTYSTPENRLYMHRSFTRRHYQISNNNNDEASDDTDYFNRQTDIPTTKLTKLFG